MIKWALKALSDSDFASDKETRISVFGYIMYFCGIPIAWRSKGMKSVVLSTTEAEYMALSEVVKESKFIVQLLQTMNIEVELPITVYVDNVGAIWLSNNRTTSDRTKHIDIRTSFIKKYQEDGKIIIKFVKSEENEAESLISLSITLHLWILSSNVLTNCLPDLIGYMSKTKDSFPTNRCAILTPLSIAGVSE